LAGKIEEIELFNSGKESVFSTVGGKRMLLSLIM
jgi:hypothetical protein